MSPRPGRSSTRRCRATEDRHSEVLGAPGSRRPRLLISCRTRDDEQRRADLRRPLPSASRVSAAGRATFDIALRLGGLFVAILLVAVVFYCINSAFLNIDVIISVLRSMSSVAIMALGPDAGHRGRRDRSLLRRHVRARRQFAGGHVDRARHADLCRDSARHRHRRRSSGSSTACSTTWLKIPSFIVTLGSYNLLYGLSLWVTNASTFNPVYPPRRLSRRPGPARLLQQSDPAVRQPSVLRRGLLDDRPGPRGRLPAASLAVRLPADGDRRQSRGGRSSPACRCAATRSWPSSSAACWRRRRASSISPSSRRPSPTSASPRPSRSSPPSSSAAPASPAARAR